MIPPHSNINLSSDGHVHTRLCNHATGEMEDYVREAIARGLKEIIFLEHLEAGIDYFERTWLSQADFDYYLAEGERLQNTYGQSISIKTGIELGYNPSRADELLAGARSRGWDRIGISCHFIWLPELGHHLNLLSRKKKNIEAARSHGIASLLERYFDTLLEAVIKLPGDVLCHLDAALRFVPELSLSDSHYQQIDTLLATVKSQGMAIEINTSGIAIRGEPFPAKRIISMAMQHGIPLVAGSDAHRPEDVGRYFDLLPGLLTSADCE